MGAQSPQRRDFSGVVKLGAVRTTVGSGGPSVCPVFLGILHRQSCRPFRLPLDYPTPTHGPAKLSDCPVDRFAQREREEPRTARGHGTAGSARARTRTEAQRYASGLGRAAPNAKGMRAASADGGG